MPAEKGRGGNSVPGDPLNNVTQPIHQTETRRGKGGMNVKPRFRPWGRKTSEEAEVKPS